MMDVVTLAGLIRVTESDRRCLNQNQCGTTSCKNAPGQICVMFAKCFPQERLSTVHGKIDESSDEDICVRLCQCVCVAEACAGSSTEP